VQWGSENVRGFGLWEFRHRCGDYLEVMSGWGVTRSQRILDTMIELSST
jgi:hypothetical protein